MFRPSDAAIARGLHVLDELVDAGVVEAHPVDDGVRLRQAEHARARIARLRARRDRAHFDKAEAERGQPVDARAVLVEPGGEPDRVAEREAHHGARRIGHVRRERAREPVRPAAPSRRKVRW